MNILIEIDIFSESAHYKTRIVDVKLDCRAYWSPTVHHFCNSQYTISVNLEKRDEGICFDIRKQESTGRSCHFVPSKSCEGLKAVLFSKTQRTIFILDHQLVPKDNQFMFKYSILQNFYGVNYIDNILLYFDPK